MGGTGEEWSEAGEAPQTSAITYCVVPRELASKLHGLLVAHFGHDRGIEVLVELRCRDRRAVAPRRKVSGGSPHPTMERRRIRNLHGRRFADRRAPVVGGGVPVLPRRARPYAGRLVFFERCEPSTQKLEDIDTARLVARLQSGEPDVLALLYERYFDRLYTYLRLLMGDPGRAEDAVQQVFLKLLEQIDRYEFSGPPFRSWLFTVVRNQAIDQLRRESRLEPTNPFDIRAGQEASQGGEEPLTALSWVSDRDLVVLIERLPLAQRQVLLLRYLLDLPVREVARVLDRSPGDVKVLQHRALSFLRARLTSLGRGSPQRRGAPMRRCFRPAPVLRGRRFALGAF
ncbi:MAG TPA: sigma-70 family RNA polymerase sigma factor [Solirubrobacteraceae bacterium]|nr:sigma-70 family RNA polymerase sigma factor [Solirubrobacteraceae bacterium]